jgi:RNA polymerase sigma-70 factor (ECF subfamily)
MLHDPVDMTDEEIVKMALQEKAFFGHIVSRYEAKLGRYIERLGVRNAEDKEDVLQEIFIKVYKNLNGFDISLSFSSWIYRIAHNEAISWYRKKNVRPEGHLVSESEELLSFVASSEDNAESIFDKEVNADVVTEALDGLDDKYKSPIILRFFEHKEYEEISDILKIPLGSVGTLIHRGKHQLRENINKEHVRI